MTRICKLVSGDVVIGILKDKKLIEPYGIGFIPNGQGGVSVTLMPFSSPFKQDKAVGEIDVKFIMFDYPTDTPAAEELIQHYLEMKSGIKIFKENPFLKGN